MHKPSSASPDLHALTLADARAIVGDAAVDALYSAGFLIVDRLECFTRSGELVSLRRCDIPRIVSRAAGLPLDEIRELMLIGDGVPFGASGVPTTDVVESSGRRVVAPKRLVSEPEDEASVASLSNREDADRSSDRPTAHSSDESATHRGAQ